MTYTRLGDLLVGRGAITREQLEQALRRQKEDGRRLGTILVEDGAITEKQVIEALQAQLGLEYVDLDAVDIPAGMARLLPRNIAQRHQVVPLRASRAELYLVMADPLNFMAIEEAAAATHRQVIPMIADAAAVDRAVQALYGGPASRRAVEELQRELSGGGPAAPIPVQERWKLSAGETDEDAAPTVRLVAALAERACAEGASDIRLEPQGGQARLRMRIDGVLREIAAVPRELQGPLTARIKSMAQMDVDQRQRPQEGRIQLTVGREPLDLEVTTLPTLSGEKVVLRLIRRGEDLSAEGIGLEGEARQHFLDLLAPASGGLVLAVGPADAGKTSTLYAMIGHLRGASVDLVCLEDPVERPIDGIDQVQVDERTGLTLAEALRAALRQEPDVVAVGELRDAGTARLAMQAALTGRTVLSTLRADGALEAILRLLDTGMEPPLVAAALRGIVSQRLVRRVCPHCRQTYAPGREELERLGLPADRPYTFCRGAGCPACFQTGYRGRTAAFEILPVSPALRQAIRGRSRDGLEAALAAAVPRTLRDDCARLVVQGVTTAEEALRAMGEQDQ